MARSAEKTPIYDEDAEAMVVGSAILNPSCLKEVDLDPADFFIENYGRLWEAILALRDRGAEISQAAVGREAPKVEPWVLQKVTAEALPVEVLHYADIVKEMSRRRKLVSSIESIMREFRQQRLSSQDLANSLRLALDAMDLPTNASRAIRVSSPRILKVQPPTYLVNVSTADGKRSADIKFTSTELDQRVVFRRKVRESLQINPLLPKDFDAFVHQILQQARAEQGPLDASGEESICYWVREWFTTASEAEHYDDLSQGYLDRDGAYWFSAERLISYVSERGRVRLDRSSFWSVIHNRGGRRSRVFSLAGKKVRLWGIEKSFLENEGEPAEGEQMALAPQPVEKPQEENDFKWLEG